MLALKVVAAGLDVEQEIPLLRTWTSKSAKIMAQYPKIESTGSIGSVVLAILEVQVCASSAGGKLPILFGRGRHGRCVKNSSPVLQLHSLKLTWQRSSGPYEATLLYTGPSMSFNVNLGEGKPRNTYIRAQSI